MERQYWWKILCVPILLYVIIAGVTVPLGTGITDISKSSAQAGETFTMTIDTYNTFLTKATKTRAWLRKEIKDGPTFTLPAQNVKVINDNQAELTFTIPSHLPVTQSSLMFSLVLDSDVDGYGVLPGKFKIKQTEIDSTKGAEVWGNVEINNLTDRGTNFPFRGLLYETIRNTYYHVPLWFCMLFLFIGATYNSLMFLKTKDPDHDLRAEVKTAVGLLFGMLGIVTGMLWAKATWGTYWTWSEIKLNMTAIALLIYFAYFVLRNAFDDLERRGKVAAVYNLFAFVAALVLINVVPRMTDSLHPGSGGNPAMGGSDLDGTMRWVFYPAIIGWSLLGYWIATIYYRFRVVEEKYLER